jgi:hypothetical protein
MQGWSVSGWTTGQMCSCQTVRGRHERIGRSGQSERATGDTRTRVATLCTAINTTAALTMRAWMILAMQKRRT